MLFSDYSFHDAEILEVKESPDTQTLDYLLNYPIDWEKNVFEPMVLRFKDVYQYSIDEMPFAGEITIMEARYLGIYEFVVSAGSNTLAFERNKVELITNAGSRTIHYTDCELFAP
jgi:hypothetical protein